MLENSANLSHEMCGTDLRTYQEWCVRQGVTPKGRVIFAIASVKFRIDKNRSMASSMQALVKIQPKSYKVSDFATFLADIKSITINLDYDDRP